MYSSQYIITLVIFPCIPHVSSFRISYKRVRRFFLYTHVNALISILFSVMLLVRHWIFLCKPVHNYDLCISVYVAIFSCISKVGSVFYVPVSRNSEMENKEHSDIYQRRSYWFPSKLVTRIHTTTGVWLILHLQLQVCLSVCVWGGGGGGHFTRSERFRSIEKSSVKPNSYCHARNHIDTTNATDEKWQPNILICCACLPWLYDFLCSSKCFSRKSRRPFTHCLTFVSAGVGIYRNSGK